MIWNKSQTCFNPMNYQEISCLSLITVASYDMPQRKTEVLFCIPGRHGVPTSVIEIYINMNCQRLKGHFQLTGEYRCRVDIYPILWGFVGKSYNMQIEFPLEAGHNLRKTIHVYYCSFQILI